MRPTELVLLASAFLTAISLLLAGSIHQSWIKVLCVLGLTALLIHAAVLRLYWQVLPAYLAVLLLTSVVVWGAAWGPALIRTVSSLSLLLVMVSTVSLIVLPFFKLPRPTGPYAVGTRILHVVDSSRADASFPSGKRELMIQLWYPTTDNRGALAPYRRRRETTLLSSYDAVMKTHSRWNAPVAIQNAPYPVLLFNPAWEGQRTQNTFQTEDLASHGFVVVAIDHTHNSTPIAFPDGRVVKASPPRAIDDFSGPLDAQITFGEQETVTQAEDDIFVLNELEARSRTPGNEWYGKLDTARTGAFGHSFGGSAAIEACFRDPRILAALNMDGWMFGQIYRAPLGKPLMMMYDSGWPFIQEDVDRERRSDYGGNRLDINDLNNAIRSFDESGGYLLALRNAKHMNFSDRALYSPFHKLTDSGTVNPKFAHRVIEQYTLAFFSHTLRGSPEPLLYENSPFPDTYFRAYPDPRLHAQQAVKK